MNKETTIGLVIFLVILAFLFWFLSNVSHDILVGLFVGLIPSGILLYLQNKKEKREHRNWLLRNKEACLIELLDLLISSIQDKSSHGEQKIREMETRLRHFQPALLAWGTGSVLRAYNEIQQINDGSLAGSIKKGERFLRIIRKELGHDDSSLKPGEVWATLLIRQDKQKALDACKDETYE